MKRGRQRSDEWHDQDDDSELSMTSQHGRRRQVMHRGQPDYNYAVRRLHPGRVVPYRHYGGIDIMAFLPPPQSHQPAVDIPHRRPRLTVDREGFSANGSWSVNDVADHRRRHFPTPIDRPPTITVDNCQVRQPLEHQFWLAHAPTSSTASWRHHPGYRQQSTGIVRPSAGAQQPRRRRVLPPVPSDLSRHRHPHFVTAHYAAADFQPRPTFIFTHEFDDDSISV